MCKHGTIKMVDLYIANKSGRKSVPVDPCIADEIQELNNLQIHTLGCCCGHGLAGQIAEHENVFGKWKDIHSPPHVLIDGESRYKAKKLGYNPFRYYYADGSHNDVWIMYLKTGCVTEEESNSYVYGDSKNIKLG